MSKLIFKNYGGSFQLKIQDAQDLENIQLLDEARWAATSVPNSSLNCDRTFLSYVDTDKNGRIRTRELKAAQTWLFRFLADRSHLSEGIDILRLCDIDTTHPEGQKLRKAAEFILTNLNLPGTEEISLSHIRDAKSIIARAADNGDGIIPPEATGDADLAGFTRSVMDTVGSTMDASGRAGISEKELEEFFHEAESYLAWKAKGEIPKGEKTTEVMPWGSETSLAYQLVAGLREKIEQYFTQCEIVAFDERARGEMRFRQKELEEIDFTNKQVMEARLKDAPLAMPNPEGILHLDAEINPLYAEQLLELKEKVIKRALGGSAKQLSKKQWEKVKNIFASHRTWLEGKQGAKVEKLGADILRSYLNGSYNERLSELIAKDLARADDLDQTHNLEKLILYQKWLMELANNFVSFANLYNPKRRALFEKGTLVIDGREITFTMKIRDRQAHKTVADKSYMYLLYVEVTGREAEDIKFEIVAPVTSGTADGLRIGKRGIFFTSDDREWDAEVVDITSNPISIWESVKAPFGQFSVFIKTQIDKFSKSGQGKLEASISRPSASGMTRDLLLGGGIAIAALGTAFAFITKAISQVKPIHVLATLAGIIIIVLLPGIIIGLTKIRKRDMSVLLEASGWAVNVRMRLSAALGRLFTHMPRLPKGARRERKDTVTQFVKEFGYSSFWSKNSALVVLIILLILTGFVVVLFTYPALKPYFAALRTG